MPKPESSAQGNVSSIIDNLHKLEYESGRLDKPPAGFTRHSMSSDHPSQHPLGDRPVPYYEKPQLHHLPTQKHRRQSPDPLHLPILKHVASPERENPFRRRDSTASNPRSPSPKRRESISHKAFERVRAASLSPPLVAHSPSPLSEVHPLNETAEQYITRKLTERWSPVTSSPRSYNHESPTSNYRLATHVDAPVVQDVLQNLEQILTEHTDTLKGVIEDSKRMLHNREVTCHEQCSELEHEGLHAFPRRKHSPDGTTNSSIPDLVRAVERTAEGMGLKLEGRETVMRHANSPLIIEDELEEDELGHVGRQVVPPPPSPLALNVSTSKLPPNRASTERFHAFPTYKDEQDVSPITVPKREIFDQPAHSTINRRMSSFSFIKDSLHPQKELTTRHLSSQDASRDSASPAIIEYDRFAALADRASRNSITELPQTSGTSSRRPSGAVMQEVIQHNPPTTRPEHSERSQPDPLAHPTKTRPPGPRRSLATSTKAPAKYTTALEDHAAVAMAGLATTSPAPTTRPPQFQPLTHLWPPSPPPAPHPSPVKPPLIPGQISSNMQELLRTGHISPPPAPAAAHSPTQHVRDRFAQFADAATSAGARTTEEAKQRNVITRIIRERNSSTSITPHPNPNANASPPTRTPRSRTTTPTTTITDATRPPPRDTAGGVQRGRGRTRVIGIRTGLVGGVGRRETERMVESAMGMAKGRRGRRAERREGES